MTEEVEVQVRDLAEEGKDVGHSFVELLRKMMLAGVGAVAMSRDETEQFVNKLVERGELAQKDAEKLLRHPVTLSSCHFPCPAHIRRAILLVTLPGASRHPRTRGAAP